ncbi:MAG: TonB-dependent receptor [Lewinellaceae bacterium]|nr:TonB-dependent receptor [Lewinellaceae bacterium]
MEPDAGIQDRQEQQHRLPPGIPQRHRPVRLQPGLPFHQRAYYAVLELQRQPPAGSQRQPLPPVRRAVGPPLHRKHRPGQPRRPALRHLRHGRSRPGKHLNLTGSLRLDYDENYGLEFTPQLNVSYILSNLTLRASAGRSIRAVRLHRALRVLQPGEPDALTATWANPLPGYRAQLVGRVAWTTA